MSDWKKISVILIKPDVPHADGKIFTRECLAEMAAEDERFFIDDDGNLCQEVAAHLTLPWEETN